LPQAENSRTEKRHSEKNGMRRGRARRVRRVRLAKWAGTIFRDGTIALQDNIFTFPKSDLGQHSRTHPAI
jgi:hypothetical protein